MTLNGVMAVASRYFNDFGKPAFQHITASISGRIYARVYCFCSACKISSQRKFTFAISSSDEFLVGLVSARTIRSLYVYSHGRPQDFFQGWANSKA